MEKILVIEDNEEVRENIAEIIQLSGYEVITADNGKTGAEKAISEKPDLIICDIMMPVLDGYGVLHLLNKHEETAGTPFIFLTAKSERSDFRKGMEMGADDYITKPFDGIELLNAVESRLKKLAYLRRTFEPDQNGVNEFIDGACQLGNITLTSDEREICHYPKKHLLYAEGQRPKSVYYVVSGKVKTYLVNEDGKEFITHVYGTGDFFGYLAMLEEMNYKDNAQVLEDAELMLIPRKDFLNLILCDLRISHQFIRMIAHNTASDEENLLNLAYNSLRKKVSFGLLKLMEKYKTEEKAVVELDISRENMASTVGVATESLIRTLGDFKTEKLIDIQNGKVIILNEKKLRDLPY
jgi:CRP-like cAMP-binding protein/CheY-like chemotaxis protein